MSANSSCPCNKRRRQVDSHRQQQQQRLRSSGAHDDGMEMDSLRRRIEDDADRVSARLYSISERDGDDNPIECRQTEDDCLGGNANDKIACPMRPPNSQSYYRHKPDALLLNRHQSTKNSSPSSSMVVSIMLPLLLVFLLPTMNQNQPATPGESLDSSRLAGDWLSGYEQLLYTLVRFPLDRMRFGSGLIPLAQAKEIHSKSDLQEEEQTHAMLVAPAEHRASYSGGQGMHGQGHAYGSTGEAAPALSHRGPEMHADYGQGGEMGAGPESGLETGGMAEVGSGVAAIGGSPSSQLQTRSDLPVVRALNVKCEKNHMTVNIVFDRPFYGMVFSKGHFNDQKCRHVPPNRGETSVNFDIHLGKCGMQGTDALGSALQSPLQQQAVGQQQQQQQQPNGQFIENTIIIQYDPQVQEIYDQARKLRCTWYDYYEKSVTFRPYNVDMMDAVTANFLGDNIQCWMQIQVGKGPWSSEVAGIVKIGQTMTMVLAIKDDDNRFDMLVRNCVAHDGKHAPIQLVDEYGCVARPKIMSKFQKVRNFGPAATVVSYAHFQAFKFPDSMSVHFQCVIQVCRSECPEPACPNSIQQQPPSDQLAGVGGAGPNADYAASGTEIVASKEPVPGFAGPYGNGSSHSSHALKLDESQGRVQVKLDTSMMAGLSGRTGAHPQPGRPSHGNSPLPPHLLHMSSGAPATPARSTSGHAFLSASYPRGSSPFVATGGGAGKLAPTVQTNSRHQAQVAPPGEPAPSSIHYSAPYPQIRRAAYATNRLGDLAGGEQEPHHQQQTDLSQVLAGMEAPDGSAHNPLSLIALPRGLRMVSGKETTQAQSQAQQAQTSSGSALLTGTTATLGTTLPLPLPQPLPLQHNNNANNHHHHPANHRYRREVNHRADDSMFLVSSNGDSANNYTNATKRHQRALPGDSTAIQTQKTIQVVSPDDVAFSLLADELIGDEPPVTFGSGASGRWRQQSTSAGDNSNMAGASTVCFSAARLMVVVLVTLSALASSIVVAAYVIFRQRSHLDDKLAAVYEIDETHERDQQVASRQHLAEPRNQPRQQQGFGAKPTSAELIARRQREELQQRNSYLARFYSQFTPANYWR